MYKIEIDQQRGIFKLTLDGAIPLEMVAALMGESQITVGRLNCRPGEHLALIDATVSTLHPKEVASAFSKSMGDIRYRARRIAIVGTSALWRLQTRRILDSDRIAFFDNLPDAETWLLAIDGTVPTLQGVTPAQIEPVG